MKYPTLDGIVSGLKQNARAIGISAALLLAGCGVPNLSGLNGTGKQDVQGQADRGNGYDGNISGRENRYDSGKDVQPDAGVYDGKTSDVGNEVGPDAGRDMNADVRTRDLGSDVLPVDVLPPDAVIDYDAVRLDTAVSSNDIHNDTQPLDAGIADNALPDVSPDSVQPDAARCVGSAPFNSNQQGVCQDSVQLCINGQWQDDYSMVVNYESPERSCDGLDNDCNGRVDVGLTPPSRACTRGTGDCAVIGLESLTCLGSAGWSSRYSGCTAQVPLRGAWNFDEAEGDALDGSGNGRNGTIVGAARVVGRRGGALSFDGANDYVRIQNVPPFTVGDSVTFSIWYKADAFGSENTFFHLGLPETLSGDYNYDIRLSGGKIEFIFLNSGRSTADLWRSTAAFTDTSSWHKLNVSFVYGTGASLQVYQDGQSVEGNWVAGTGNDTPFAPASNQLTLGSYQQSGGYSQTFNGRFDEARIYDCALSGEQILGEFEGE